MTSHPTRTGAEHLRTGGHSEQHRHGNACFWNADDCRWQCAAYPLLGCALEDCTPTGPSVPDRGTTTP